MDSDGRPRLEGTRHIAIVHWVRLKEIEKKLALSKLKDLLENAIMKKKKKGLTFNYKKTEYMVVCKRDRSRSKLHIGDVKIEVFYIAIRINCYIICQIYNIKISTNFDWQTISIKIIRYIDMNLLVKILNQCLDFNNLIGYFKQFSYPTFTNWLMIQAELFVRCQRLA